MWDTTVVLAMRRHTFCSTGLWERLWWQERLLSVWEHLYAFWLPDETSDHLRLGSASMHPSLLWRNLRLRAARGQADWWYCHLRLPCFGGTTEVWCEHCCLRTRVSLNFLKKPVALLWAVFVIVCSVRVLPHDRVGCFQSLYETCNFAS